jgi:periplasmic divalent cation tolerance protein
MKMDQSEVFVVLVTAGSQEEAARIAEVVVRSHHAACATVIPAVRSLYWWEGTLMSEQESLVIIKTTESRFELVQDTIRSIHSYQVPEIIALPVAKGLPQYLEWVRKETTGSSG